MLLISKDLYTATLQALLHYSLLNYQDRARSYDTRGGPPGAVSVHSVPYGVTPSYQALNAHAAWGLYWSVIAFNNPNNLRETVANIIDNGLLVAQIFYRRAFATSPSAPGLLGNATAGMSFASTLQMFQGEGDESVAGAVLPQVPEGYSIRWVLVPNGAKIRRQTAYDTVAYAILWTAQFREPSRFTGTRRISVPGGRVSVYFASWQIARWEPMTFGTAATNARLIPLFLELEKQFQEGFVEFLAPDGQVVGNVGIFVTEGNADHLFADGNRIITTPESSDVPSPSQLQTA
ncbi:MAG: hypothetical protein Q9179_005190 [Wetmoreana sp. 5 TL-2023]